MKDVERAILGLLLESGLRLTPNNIAENTGYSSGYVRKECKRLSDEGFLDVSGNGGYPFYSITDRGRAYLAGNLDASELEDGDG